MVERAAEALRQAGMLGTGRVVATEPLTGGQVSSVSKVLLSTGRAVVLKIARAGVVETEALWLQGWRDIGIDTPEVYGHGVLADATPFLLMEFVEGPNVRTEMEAGRLPTDGDPETDGAHACADALDPRLGIWGLTGGPSRRRRPRTISDVARAA